MVQKRGPDDALARPSRPRWLALALTALAVGILGSSFEPADSTTWTVPEPDLYGVAARGDLAWAVGYWGAAFRSDDGGETWERVATPTDATLYDVAFGDDRSGWAVGVGGTLLRSDDGGRSWTALSAEVIDPFDGSRRPLDSALFGVAAISATEAWVVGDFGVVLHTRDGKRWDPVVIPQEAFADDNIPDRIFNAVHFHDRERGWIVGEFGTTLRTSDGGETWVGERTLEGVVEDIYLFDVGANGTGWALAGGVGGVSVATRDGGASWSSLRVPTTAGLFGTSVRGSRGVLVGDRGVLLFSSDEGRTWAEPERPRSFNWLRSAAFGNDQLAYVVGEEGLILRSQDGGRSWEWRLGRRPPPSSGISVPDPAGRAGPLLGDPDPYHQNPAPVD